MSNIKITPGVVWNKWCEVKPPISTWVLARWPWMEIHKGALVKTCRRGCCVYANGANLILPMEWIEALPEFQHLVDVEEEEMKRPYKPINIVDFLD